VRVGEPVAAIGSPFGQAQSLSVGIVSAIDRSVGSLTEFDIAGAIQTDAAINPGNSGGPYHRMRATAAARSDDRCIRRVMRRTSGRDH
jgi:S1-C subfamily serine protease